jgi:hypothetical protein
MKSFSRSLVTLQASQAFAPVVLNGQVQQSLSVAGFTGVVGAAGLVTSRVFAIQALALPNKTFSIRSNQGFAYENFFVCVKWSTDGVTMRYSLWKPSGATLQVTPYAGQIIPTSLWPQLEFWSTSESTETPVVPSFSILTDIIEDPATCCDTSGTVLANSICSIGQPGTLDEMFQTCL